MKELWANRQESEKLDLINEAIDVINESLDIFVGDSINEERFNILLIESLREIDPADAEETARRMFEAANDGTGYYTIAHTECLEKNPEEAIKYIRMAITAAKYPYTALILLFDILLQIDQPPYEELYPLVERLSELDYEDTWKSAYHKAIIYAVNGDYGKSKENFANAFKIAPRLSIDVERIHFWKEDGRRRTFTGKIGRIYNSRTGEIYSHDVDGWISEIFFNPSRQKDKIRLKTGLFVDFELGFSSRGPIAWDVRPHKRKLLF